MDENGKDIIESELRTTPIYLQLEAADKLAEAVIAERHAYREGHTSSSRMAREKIYDALNVYLDVRKM